MSEFAKLNVILVILMTGVKIHVGNRFAPTMQCNTNAHGSMLTVSLKSFQSKQGIRFYTGLVRGRGQSDRIQKVILVHAVIHGRNLKLFFSNEIPI